jgi:hypothetical protein
MLNGRDFPLRYPRYVAERGYLGGRLGLRRRAGRKREAEKQTENKGIGNRGRRREDRF